MKDSIMTKTELNNLQANTSMVSSIQMPLHLAKINMAEWAYNNGDLRTIAEYKNRIQNIKEEIIALEFAQDISQSKAIAKAKLEELLYLSEIEEEN